jgi:hypothetical protein
MPNCHFLSIGRDGDEVSGNGLVDLQAGQPVARGMRIGHGLNVVKVLEIMNKLSAGSSSHRLDKVHAVDIGDKRNVMVLAVV